MTGVEPTAVRRWLSCHPMFQDIALACAVVAFGVAGELSGMRGQTDGVVNARDVLALAVAALAVVTRRRWPALVLVATAVAASVLFLIVDTRQPVGSLRRPTFSRFEM